MVMQSQKKPNKRGKRRVEVQRPRRLNEDFEEELDSDFSLPNFEKGDLQTVAYVPLR